jgi:hypothetical protein
MSRLRLSLFIVSVLLSGCISREVATLASLPSPLDDNSFCCWQATQKLTIDFDGQQHQLLAAMAKTEQGTSIAILDPLGRRLLSIQDDGKELDIKKTRGLPEDIPAELLLRIAQLSWWPGQLWENLSGTNWSLDIDGGQRLLKYNKRNIIRISGVKETSSMQAPEPSSIITVQHYQRALKIIITTEQWQQL